MTFGRFDVSTLEHIRRLIDLAREEDLGAGDLSTRFWRRASETAAFRMIARAPCVFAGREVVPAVLAAYDLGIEIEWAPAGCDGTVIEDAPTPVATITGPCGQVLAAERVVLNFVQRLCGVATQTRRFVEAVAGTGAAIYDTRKTTPGWRALDKYAVRCGGGMNHRQGLFDAVLLKDNHLAGVEPGRLGAAVFAFLNELSKSPVRPAFVAVEADGLSQVEQLLQVVGVDVVLLDNFSLVDLRAAVRMRNDLGLAGKVALEASGGVTLADVRAVAQSGVDRISVGALTHSAVATDLSLERAG